MVVKVIIFNDQSSGKSSSPFNWWFTVVRVMVKMVVYDIYSKIGNWRWMKWWSMIARMVVDDDQIGDQVVVNG